jgi:hypothetical protein
MQRGWQVHQYIGVRVTNDGEDDKTSNDRVRISDDGEEEETRSTLAEETRNRPTPIRHGMIRQFDEQDIRRGQHTKQVGGRQQMQLVEAEFLEGELARWYGRCWIWHERDGMNGMDWRIVGGRRVGGHSSGRGRCRKRCDRNGIRGVGDVDYRRRYVSNGCRTQVGSGSIPRGMLHGRDGEIWAGWMQWLQYSRWMGRSWTR